MTNPNNALGTPNAYSGLTSEEAFVSNADNLMSVGVVKGFTMAPNNPLGMSVLVGGVSGTPDRANVKNVNGEVFTIQNRSHAPIQVNIAPASQTQPRLDVVIAYRNFGGTSDSAKQDNTKLVGIIAVAGTPSATPVIPTDAQIRAAITADGGIGSSAGYFIVPRSISVPAGATTLSSSNLSVIAVDNATMPANAVNIAKCRVSLKNATTNIPANSGAPINLDLVDYQIGTEWSNNRFTVKVSGIYDVSGRVLSNNASSYNSLIYKNGTANANIVSNGSSSGGSIVSDTLKLSAGDWIQLGMWNGSGSQASPYADGNGSNTYINISQIG